MILAITLGLSGCSAIRDTLKPKPPEPLLLQGDKIYQAAGYPWLAQ
jgi:uncharacterized protein YceK